MMQKSRPRVEHLVSAGGVVYRLADSRMEVVLCGRADPPMWSLPKGTPDAGETLEETALREVQEETGLDVRIVAPLGSIEYWFYRGDVRCHKTVHYNLMEPVGGSVDRHDPEFDMVQWFDADRALECVTYPNDAQVVRRAIGRVRGHGDGTA